jgi:hypothetical protein
MTTIGYTNYTNLDAYFGRGYRRGDRLVKGYSGEIEISDLEYDLEAIFARHNRDDRPDGRLCPSMSVGDVIILGEGAFTVESEGFSPINLDLRDLITDRTWSEVDR